MRTSATREEGGKSNDDYKSKKRLNSLHLSQALESCAYGIHSPLTHKSFSMICISRHDATFMIFITQPEHSQKDIFTEMYQNYVHRMENYKYITHLNDE